MGKKAATKSPRKQKKVKKDAVKAKTLDEQAKEEKEAKHHSSLKRRRLGRRDSDEKVERGIRCHFGWMSKSLLSSKRVDGLLLRERIEQDRKRLGEKKGCQKLGPSYWRDLSVKYGSGLGDFSVLPEVDKRLTVSDKLTESLTLATSSDCRLRTADTAIAFFASCPSLNVREIVGTARTIAGSKYIGVRGQDVLFLEFSKCLARHGWQHCSKEFLDILREVMDPTMCRLYQRLTKNGVKEETFVETYRAVITLLIPEGPLTTVVNCRRQFGRCMQEVKKITASSALGDLIYGYVHGLLDGNQLQAHITAALEKLEGTVITVQSFSDWKLKVAEEIEDYSANPILLRRRIIEVELWNTMVPAAVHSPLLELNVRADAFLKRQTLGKSGGLPLLLYEAWCYAGADMTDVKSLVDEALISSMQAARKVASEVLSPKVIACVADLGKLLDGAREALLSLDQSFAIELSFVESSLPAVLTSAIEKRCLSLLPTEAVHPSLVEVKDAMVSLRESQLVQISNRSMQDKLDSVVETLENLSRTTSPPTSYMQSSPFFKAVLQQMQFFCRYVPKTNKDGKANTASEILYGSAALKMQIKELHDQCEADPSSLTLSKLDGPQCCRWLLAPEDVKTLDSLVTKCLAGSSKAESSAAGSSSDPAKKTKKKHDPGSGSASVMRFF